MRGWLNRIVLLAALACITRCGTTSPTPTPGAAPPPAVAIPTAEVGGLWTGTTTVTPCQRATQRCNAVNNVTFRLTQYGSQLVGNYSCGAGNTTCRHGGADDSGNITAGSVSGNRINLAVKISADASDCYYSGATNSLLQASGVYMCYRGGRLAEEGTWNLVRQAQE